MAGDADDPCIYLLSLLCLFSLFLSDGVADFNDGCNCNNLLQEEKNRGLQLRKKFDKKKISEVFERPQFKFEHMVLSQYATFIWQENFCISPSSAGNNSLMSASFHGILSWNCFRVTPRRQS